MVTLLMTRAEDASRRFVQRLPGQLRARLRVVTSPLIGVAPVAGTLDPAPARGIIFTSGNGVAVASSLTRRRDIPCFCVGRATTEAARDAGWKAACAGRTADELVADLSARRPAAPLLHLRGKHARGNIATRLTAAGVETHEQVIYDQHLLALNARARAALAGTEPVIVPLFSPRTARHFASLCRARAPLYIAAMSKAVAEPLVSLGPSALDVADIPEAQAMAEAVARLARRAGRVAGPSGGH